MTCDDADEPGNPAPEVDPLSLCLSGVLRTPSVSSATDGRTEELRSLTAKLAQAVYELTGQPITGRPLLRAEAVASRHLDDADGLLAYAYGLKGYRRFGGVLDALESWIPKAPTPGRPVCEECGVVGPVEVCTYRLETCPMGADAS